MCTGNGVLCRVCLLFCVLFVFVLFFAFRPPPPFAAPVKLWHGWFRRFFRWWYVGPRTLTPRLLQPRPLAHQQGARRRHAKSKALCVEWPRRLDTDGSSRAASARRPLRIWNWLPATSGNLLGKFGFSMSGNFTELFLFLPAFGIGCPQLPATYLENFGGLHPLWATYGCSLYIW
mgnify:CR=1 FL=1